MQDAGRNEMQDGLVVADHHGVAGVVSSLEAHHPRATLAQEIDDFTLAFVTPLSADDDYRSAHS